MGRNTFFQFKQFRIEQDKCAMKVTTEGCLFGASIQLDGTEARILDIGTGTGLLSLMLAQRAKGQVLAVELDTDAAKQAEDNFNNSPWSERLEVANMAIQEYAGATDETYDLVVCNPPFFSNHFKSGKAKDRAIHNDSMGQQDLLESVLRLLSDNGTFWVIYPKKEYREFEQLAIQNGLYHFKRISVRNTPDSGDFRVIGAFQKSELIEESAHSVVTIRGNDGEYSAELTALLEDYYL